jgi:hypothetical protein
MSTKPSFPITATLSAGNARFVHRHNADPASLAMSLRTKMVIALAVLALALLYAKGITLMLDTADTPSAYATFLNRAD